MQYSEAQNLQWLADHDAAIKQFHQGGYMAAVKAPGNWWAEGVAYQRLGETPNEAITNLRNYLDEQAKFLSENGVKL